MNYKWLVGAAAALVLSGCAMAQRAESAIDCNGICSRYSECFDKDYDRSTCVDKCRTSARADSDFRRKVDICMACITDRSCTAATFACGTECASIVP